jgi:hypothetical protein
MKLREVVSSIATTKQEIETKSKTWVKGQAARFESSGVGKRAAGIKRWLKFEGVLAATLVLSPLLLIVNDGWPTGSKSSISAYYEMGDPANLWAFYFPLTLAAMMLIVNGIIINKAWYYIVLGIMLSGVILFNHDDFSIIHNIFAYSFFIGNGIVILKARTRLFSKQAERFFDRVLISIIILFVVLLLLHVVNLFVVEWVSFAMISTHFILSSRGTAAQVSSGRTRRASVNA